MDLLDRYLDAVKKYLPWERQDDILAELKANLESQLDDKQAELGRPLTSDEAAHWLKQLGPPIQMAARYQPQRSLIGPTLFPFYRYVLQLACSWALGIYAIVMVVQAFVVQAPAPAALMDALIHAPGVLFTTAVWVTLTFAVIEFCSGQYPEVFKNTPLAGNAWSPASLPPVGNSQPLGRKIGKYPRVVTEVIFDFIFLIWLLLVPQNPFLLMGPGVAFLYASPFTVAPVLVKFYWAVVILSGLQFTWRAADLWAGRWQIEHPLRTLIFKALGLIPSLILLSALDHVYVVLKHPAQDMAHYGAMLDTINQAAYKVVCLICAIVVLQLLWKTGEYIVEVYRKRAAAIL